MSEDAAQVRIDLAYRRLQLAWVLGGFEFTPTSLESAVKKAAQSVEALGLIAAIVAEPLDERRGQGPTRAQQFGRIEEALRSLGLNQSQVKS